MTNFFSSISEYFSLAWDIFMNSRRSLITMFSVLISSMTIHNTILSLMPSILAACAMIVSAVSILKFILGRIGGGN